MSRDAVPDVTVIGGGVIGCAVAWQLARRGARVEILEAAEPGEGASGAAAGVLGPLSHSIADSYMTDFALDALREIRAHAGPLREETGIDFGYCTDGVLRVALTEGEVEGLRAFQEHKGGLGLELRWVDGPALRALVPWLTPAARAGMFSPSEPHVLPGPFTRALARAAHRAGAQIVTGTRVLGIERDGRRVTAVRTAGGLRPVAALVVASGAEAAGLGETLGVPLPVRPVRGHLAALRPDVPFGGITVFAGESLLSPKPIGEVWCGGTVQDGEAEPRVTAEAVGALVQQAIALAPSLADAAFVRAWAGLRPAMPDGLPALGPLPGLSNAFAALGFFRNGVLMSLLAGRVMAGLLLDNSPGRDIAPLDPARFGGR